MSACSEVEVSSDAAQTGQQIAQAAIGAGQSQIAEQSSGAGVEDQGAIAASFVGEGEDF